MHGARINQTNKNIYKINKILNITFRTNNIINKLSEDLYKPAQRIENSIHCIQQKSQNIHHHRGSRNIEDMGMKSVYEKK